jgi:Flp pilus assembly CpaF family ATPase
VPDVRSPEGSARELVPRESLGPLDAVLSDPAVFHVVVERFDRVRADRGAGLQLERASFATPEALVKLAHELRAQAYLASDVACYDVSLASGLQVVAVLPAAATNGVVMSIRRRPTHVVPLAEREAQEQLSPALSARIQAALVRGHLWVVGPAGVDLAGFVSSILASCPDGERVALFERAPEIALGERAAICLKHGAVPVAELLERVPAFRPDRLVFHGLRESELKSLLETLGQRAEGYLASFAARSAQDALAAFDRSVGPDLTLRAVSLLVELKLDDAGATRVAAAYAIELDASGGLVLR